MCVCVSYFCCVRVSGGVYANGIIRQHLAHVCVWSSTDGACSIQLASGCRVGTVSGWLGDSGDAGAAASRCQTAREAADGGRFEYAATRCSWWSQPTCWAGKHIHQHFGSSCGAPCVEEKCVWVWETVCEEISFSKPKRLFLSVSPPVDLFGFDLWPLTVHQSGVRRPAADLDPYLRQPGGGAKSPRNPRHLQPQPAGEGGVPGGDVEHHPATAYGEAHMTCTLIMWLL